MIYRTNKIHHDYFLNVCGIFFYNRGYNVFVQVRIPVFIEGQKNLSESSFVKLVCQDVKCCEID